MTSQMLPMIMANAEYDLNKGLPFVQQGDANKKIYELVCRAYRVRGICRLFLEGLPGPLHADLQNSGKTFLQYLKSARDDELVTSKGTPFFDSIAGNDFETARQIAAHSRHTWNNDEEYEDDFLYVDFLMKHFFMDGGEDEIEKILQKFADLVGDESSPRLDVCQAFVNRDGQAFDEALGDLILEYQAYYQEGFSRDEILEEVWATEGHLFIEGLALIRMGELLKMPVQKEYAHIPSMAC